MSATVAAALKKILVAILTDPKARKTFFTILLILLLVILFPLFAMAAVFKGALTFDTDELVTAIEENLTVQEIAMLASVENTMNAIDTAMKDAGMPSKVTEAQALYIMALYDHAGSSNFVSRLVGCFREGQSDTQLIARVNRTFGTEIPVEEFTQVANSFRSTYIDYSHYVDPTTKNNLDLVAWAEEACSSGWGYVWGTFGRVLSNSLLESKIAQYPDNVGIYEEFIRANWLGKRTADCVGLIKGYCWFDPESQSVGYAINGMPDYSTDPMINWCREKGSIDTMPEIPGLLLWKPGHVGIYIGDGYAIEAMGTKYGVVKTKVAGRGWKKWGKIPCIEYIEEAEESEPTVPVTTPAA